MNKQLKTLIKMENKLVNHLNNLLEELEEKDWGERELNKFDIEISFGGESFKLEFNADIHSGLEHFIVDQIKIEEELQEKYKQSTDEEREW